MHKFNVFNILELKCITNKSFSYKIGLPFCPRAPITTWEILTINELLQALCALAAQYLVFA